MGDTTIRWWDLSDGKQIRQVGSEVPVLSVAASADGSRVLVGQVNGVIRLFDGNSGSELRRFSPPRTEPPMGALGNGRITTGSAASR